MVNKMKPVKQKGQEYVGLDLRLESVVDALMYHPWNRKRRQRKFNKDVYLRKFRRLIGPTRKKYGTLRDLHLYFCGVSHLDAAWLFPVVDTKERAYKTFYKAIEHCKLYPWFRFAQTSPQYYAWIKKYDKKLWDELKEYIKIGKIEPTGGMWVEPDLDMPCGESLVRQRLYGQLFYLREFGFYPTMSSLLDVFGYPWTLPQILKKTGAKSFWTTKLMANGTAGWPFSTFLWRGIDGYEMFSFVFTYNWYVLQSSKRFRRLARYPASKYNNDILNSHMMNSEIEKKFSTEENDYNHNMPIWYGLGDGGRGPMEMEILYAGSLAKLHNAKHIGQHEYIELLREEVDKRYFIWDDELFLETHRGTKTSQNNIKHLNRRAECWATAAESILTIINLYYPDLVEYDKEKLFEMWRLILFNQFHDILPGSSIPDVYVLAFDELEKSIQIAKEQIYNLLNMCLSTNKPDDTLLVFNPYNWERSEYVLIDNGEDKNWLWLPNIPELSIKAVNTQDRINNSITEEELNNITEEESAFIIENENLRARIDKKTGSLGSLLYKKTNKECIKTEGTYKGLGSGLRVFTERAKMWKAWNIEKIYPLKKIFTTILEPAKITEGEGGVLQVSVVYKFLNSSCKVSFFLLPNDKMLRINIHSNVKDGELLIKYFIPLDLASDEVTASIPYGSIQRKRIKKTEREKGKWEMGTQKWVDISDLDFGVTILNDNRYGFNATRHGIYVTLTKTSKYPGVSPLYGATRIVPPSERPKYIDLKPFDYRIAILPHKGKWQDHDVWKNGMEFNLPLILYNPSNKRDKPFKVDCIEKLSSPFVEVDKSNIFIGAIKPPEWCGGELKELKEHDNWTWDKKSFILRIIELSGKSTVARVKINEQISLSRILETNLLEMGSENGLIEEISGNSFVIDIKPFEIRTFLIFLK
ncbi:MAG: hypothetical protein GF364_15965 [Candidatus Lokiarchaeota archaeon]|nr:hypothetical protein [Candidatus Lokiarchaeota archaeon]